MDPAGRGLPFSEALLAALATVFGLELARVIVPMANSYLVDVRGLEAWAAGLFALAVFAAGALAPPVLRRRGPPRALALAAGGLVVARLGVQGAPSPGVTFAFAAAGSACFCLYLALHFAARRPAGPAATGALGLAVSAGLAAGTALHASLGTLDLAWRQGAWPWAVLLPAAALLSAAGLRSAAGLPSPAGATSPGAGFAAVGPWLFLQMVVFANPAGLAARSGVPLPAAAMMVAGGLATGLLLAWWQGPWRSRGGLAKILGPPLALIAGLALDQAGGAAAGWGVLLGQVGLTVLWVDITAAAGRADSPGERPRRLWPGAVVAGGGPALLVVLLFLYYARFRYPLGLSGPAILFGAALALAVLGAWAAARLPADALVPRPDLRAVLAAAILPLAAAGVTWAVWGAPPAVPPSGTTGEVRVATYNLHQGFGIAGALEAEELARMIEAAGAEVVALQEVPRGWVVAGSVDLMGWLAHRLGMHAVFGPAADAQWGNAVLSRRPPRRVFNRLLPPDSLLLRRAVLDLEVDLGGAGLRLLATHLHHRRGTEADAVRRQQVEALLSVWGDSERTLLLGDLNAVPESAAMARLGAAGFHEASGLLPPEGRATFPGDGRQIDYVWATPDLALERPRVLVSDASDHLPVAVTVRPGALLR